MKTIAELPVKSLSVGGHGDTKDAMCIMEAASWLNNEPWSDAPKCVPPTIRRFSVYINDNGPQWLRDELLLRAEKMIGLDGSKAAEQKRMFIAADYAVRTFAPTALELQGLTAHAAKLRTCPKITNKETALEGQRIARAAAADYYAAAAAAAAADAAEAAADAAAADAADAAEAATYAADTAANDEPIWRAALACLDEMMTVDLREAK